MAGIKCPKCGAPGASKFLWIVKCVNKECAKFDMEHFMASDAMHASSPPPAPVPVPVKPPPNAVEILYRNFNGEEKSYFGDASTVRYVRNHVSICLAPTGRRCTFNQDNILNMPALEPKLPKRKPKVPWREAQILGYYRKHGGSSAEFERIRREYPDA